MLSRTETVFDDFDREGIAVAPGVLGPERVRQLRAILDDVAETERENGTAWRSNGNQRIFMLLNRHEEFLDLIAAPEVLDVVRQRLGPDVLLSSFTANIALPGNVAQALHTDQQYVAPPWQHALTVNVVWMLDDFTEENGGTRYVPRSHAVGWPPVTEDIGTESMTGSAGDVAFIDGRIWHGTGVNRSTGQVRRALFAYYCVPYLRQQENFSRSLDKRVRDRLDANGRELLGFDIWNGLGVVDGLPRDWIGRTNRSGPTNADGIFDE